MSIRWLSVFLAFCMICATTGVACAQQDSFRSLPSVYRVVAKQCTHEPQPRILTGFRVQGVTGIITALHGVADCRSITATSDDGNSIKELNITQVDIDHDVALVWSKQLQAISLPAALPVRRLRDEPLTGEDKLIIVGHPYTKFSQDAQSGTYIEYETLQEVTEGTHVYAGLKERGSPSLAAMVLKLDGAHLLPGHSGAPVLHKDKYGILRLVGVANGGIREDDKGVSWASWAMLWSDIELKPVGTVKGEFDALKRKDPAAALSFSSTFPAETSAGAGKPTTRSVMVRDSDNNNPVKNADVTLVLEDRYEMGRTTSKGYANFELWSNDKPQGIYIQADGYEVEEQTFTGINRIPWSVDLTPVYCMFSVTVVDHRSKPVAWAKVTITSGGQITQCGRTDSEGYSTCSFRCTQHAPTITVDVLANGYKSYKKNAYRLSDGMLWVSLKPDDTPTPIPTPQPTLTPVPTNIPTPEPPTVWNFRLEGSQAALYYVDLDTGSFAADYQPSGAADILLDGGTTFSWFVVPPTGNSARIAQTGQQIGSKEGCASQSLSDSGIPLSSTDLTTGIWFCARTNEGRIAEFWLQKLNLPNTFAFTIRLWP